MGYTIALPSVMGHVRDPAQYARATERLRSLGHTLIEDPYVLNKHGFHSAPVQARLAAFQDMLAQGPDVVMPVRGGYGMTQLLPYLDWNAIRRSGAKFIGFSDFTAFSLAALVNGMVTYAGPMAAPDFGNEQLDEFTNRECWNTLREGRCTIEVASDHDLPAQRMPIEGTLWGTNLSLLAHLVGTPYMPRIEEGILLIEDVGEEPYACDRALMQLDHAGHLSTQRAVILGAFNGYDQMSVSAQSYPFADWVADLRRRYNMPILTDFPFGHVARKATLPIGGRALLTIRRDGYSLSVSTT